MKDNLSFRLSRKIINKFGYLLLSLVILLSGCKSSKTKKHPIKEETVRIEIKNEKISKEERKIEEKLVEEAMTWLGTPYKYGASEKGKATDCSGMMLCIFEKIKNVKLPRNSAKQAEFCENLKKEEIRTGDLVFFATGNDKNQISHVGMMIDELNFIHASASKGVIISDITTPYYQRTFKMFGRVPEN